MPAQTSERPLHDYVAEVSERTDVRIGVPLPLGTHARGEGVNFAFFSRNADRVRLEFFDHPEDSTAARTIDLDPVRNRTGDVWHVWVEGIRPGQLYAYRVDGPYRPKDGHRFNFNKLLLDPFTTAISRLPDGADAKEKRFACLISEDERRALYLMFNAGAYPADFVLPPAPPGTRWHRCADTSGCERAAGRFKLDLAEMMEDRHHLTRELNSHRIRKFKLEGFVDSFFSSCFIHVRKPDADIFQLALDISQARARQVVYIENTPMFIRIAEGLGIRSILHTDYASTRVKLASFGLHNDEGDAHEAA
jgi:hypothetical protein